MSNSAQSNSARVAQRTIGTVTYSLAEIRRATAVIDDSGIAGIVEAELPKGGRRRNLQVRALLVGLMLLAHSGQPTYLKRIAGTLNNLPASTRRELGVTTKVTTRMVEVLFGHITTTLDSSTNFAGRDIDDDEGTQRDQRLQQLLDALLAATLPTDDEYTTTGDLAFDATLIDANSQPERTKHRKAIKAAIKRANSNGKPVDLEALVLDDEALAGALGVGVWGKNPVEKAETMANVRRSARKAADPDAATIVHKGKLRHAYAVHLAVDVPDIDTVAVARARELDVAIAAAAGRSPSAPLAPPVPLVVRRMTVTASTAAPGATGAALLKDLAASAGGQRNNWRPSDLVADRGYSNAKTADWHEPLRDAGYRLIHDLHPTRRGHTTSHNGVVIIDGQPYSPGILNYQTLVNITPPPVGATRATIEQYQKTIEKRRPFLLPRHTKEEDAVRFTCPALRNKLACPVRNTLPLTAKGAPEVFTPPSAPLPALCRDRTVRVPNELLAQSQDRDLLYGSVQWYDAFTRRRPRVEGTNGIVKNPTGPHLAAMRVRVRGRAKVSVMVGFVIAAANLGAVAAWRATCERIAELTEAAKTARRSRKPKDNAVRRIAAKSNPSSPRGTPKSPAA